MSCTPLRCNWSAVEVRGERQKKKSMAAWHWYSTVVALMSVCVCVLHVCVRACVCVVSQNNRDLSTSCEPALFGV